MSVGPEWVGPGQLVGAGGEVALIAAHSNGFKDAQTVPIDQHQ
jgi:hypothetical protein